MDKITFTLDDGSETVDFFVLDETRISGVNYLLVTDSMDEEAEALILKDTASEADTESVYEIVSDDNELKAIAKVFEEAIGDISFE